MTAFFSTASWPRILEYSAANVLYLVTSMTAADDDVAGTVDPVDDEDEDGGLEAAAGVVESAATPLAASISTQQSTFLKKRSGPAAYT